MSPPSDSTEESESQLPLLPSPASPPDLCAQRNIVAALVFTLGYYVSMGIWGMVTLGPYLFLLANGSNTRVGMAEGIQGAAQAIVAIPSGLLADKGPRSRVLKLASLVGIGATAVLVAGEQKGHFGLLTVGLAAMGMYKGMWNPALQAIFADSAGEALGERSRLFTLKFACTVLGTASGPILSIAMFAIVGDHWGTKELSRVFLLGLLIQLPFVFLLIMFRDVESSAPAIIDSERVSPNRPSLNDSIIVQDKTPPNLLSCLSPGNIPAICAISEMVSGLASGMTIKFFPLFFEIEVGLSPIAVSVVWIISPLMMAIFSLAAQRIALKHGGRIRVSVICKTTGIALLVAMGFMKPIWKVWWIIAPVYILRTALMNCTLPLTRSTVMDYADKGSRGKWSSLESITSFGWSGSAVLGGIMADHFGYGYTFFATAGLQLISTIILSLGWNLVPPEKCAATQTKSEKDPDSLFEAYDEQLHMNAVAAVRLLQEEEDGSHSHS